MESPRREDGRWSRIHRSRTQEEAMSTDYFRKKPRATLFFGRGK